MNKTLLLGVFASAALLGGCETPFSIPESDPIASFSPLKQFKVKLEVKNGALVNDKGRNNKCTAFSDDLKKGCFYAEENDVLELQFQLKKRSDGASWRLAELQICAGDAKPAETEDCALNDEQMREWLVISKKQLAVVPGTGTVDLTQFSDTLRVVTILDINGIPGNYTYNIRACKEGKLDDDNCVWMDPGGTNTGRTTGFN